MSACTCIKWCRSANWSVSSEVTCAYVLILDLIPNSAANVMSRASFYMCSFHICIFIYENTPIQMHRKFHHQKLKTFRLKTDIFHISDQNIDCGYSLEPPRRSGSNEYSQSMFLSRNKKNNVYPCKPQFYYIKVGFKGFKII